MLRSTLRPRFRSLALFTVSGALSYGGCAVDDSGTGGAFIPRFTTADTSGPGVSASSSASAGGGQGGNQAVCGPDVTSPDETLPDTTDPEGGAFTLDKALAELPEGPGPLQAILSTDLGPLTCELFADKAPLGVANFVGLARGRRPWKIVNTTEWVKRPFYDDLLFYKVTPGQAVFSGDPLNNAMGLGGPGYIFKDENASQPHVAGSLAYARPSANLNGSQFYIAVKALPVNDGKDTVFGQCGPVDLLSTLSDVDANSNGKPDVALHVPECRRSPSPGAGPEAGDKGTPRRPA